MSRKLSSALRILPARSVNKTAIRFVATRRRRAASTLLSIESELTVTGSVSRASAGLAVNPEVGYHSLSTDYTEKICVICGLFFGLTGRAGHGGRWSGRQLL